MSPENFCYWLQGKLEGRDVDSLPAAEVECIQDHLGLVFDKRTPDRGHTPERGDERSPAGHGFDPFPGLKRCGSVPRAPGGEPLYC